MSLSDFFTTIKIEPGQRIAASDPPRAPTLSPSESLQRYGTVAFALEISDAAVIEGMKIVGAARFGAIEFGLWFEHCVPTLMRPRVQLLVEDLAPRVLVHFEGLRADRETVRQVVDWLMGALVHRIEENGGRTWLEGAR
jgi:DNA primase